MPDYEDVAYEDSVCTDSWLEEAYEDTQSGSLWTDPCISYEEDSRDYETWSPEDCVAENVWEGLDF